jgi:hypothetical protein
VALVNAHISADMLRFPKRRAPWLTARCLFLNTPPGSILERFSETGTLFWRLL